MPICLRLHPLDLWCASEFRNDAESFLGKTLGSSSEARRVGSAWLLSSRNRRAQDLRLRIRMEKDAFSRMTPYWQRLGFPFKTMVPSYATAIGSSSDRPVALAELVGILVNDGVRRPSASLTKIHFAGGTPYETVLEQAPEKGERVLAPEIARTVRKAMADVVEQGTARRLNGVFKLSDGKPSQSAARPARATIASRRSAAPAPSPASRATNRTATFVFYIGERYFGVITAFVQGREAENYHFTSALPVTLLKLLAPAIIARMENRPIELPNPPAAERRRC